MCGIVERGGRAECEYDGGVDLASARAGREETDREREVGGEVQPATPRPPFLLLLLPLLR